MGLDGRTVVESAPREILTRQQVLDRKPLPFATQAEMSDALERTRQRMVEANVWSPNQVLGHRSSIGCVALEVTQRCNLDCSLCYLSENSESIKDIPIEEVFRRIRQIKCQFGPNTDIQITGGDPTLRDRKELIEIVRYIREYDMRPTLMTNGIAATRSLLTELVDAGLNDLAFHVDLTEERPGYKTEVELNEVRAEYIERVRGLAVAVIFNTTVCEKNFHEIPDLVRFFRKNADVVGMASFQLQADTGRGALRKRHQVISLDTVRDKIEEGAETEVSFESVRIGHPRCHQYGLTLEANGNLYDLFDDEEFFVTFLDATRSLDLDRTRPARAIWTLVKWLMGERQLWKPGIQFLWNKLTSMRKDIWSSKGRVHKLTFFMQNFMDADSLEADRVHACSFMVMTGQGPMSMCLHNAKRDNYILQPVELEDKTVWEPLTGKTLPQPTV